MKHCTKASHRCIYFTPKKKKKIEIPHFIAEEAKCWGEPHARFEVGLAYGAHPEAVTFTLLWRHWLLATPAFDLPWGN